MTDLTRGNRARRGGRRPGWLLMTVLLVLAIAASSALVFTSKVELLKLAVILALWAAVVAAFVSVIYRRQSDADQAKVRDLKLVYDLQLDREISARREYELSVETHLRRELSSELRAQAADEVAGLRAELAALRANLEILFDADLSHRPAIETDRSRMRSYGDWAPNAETTGRVTASRIDTDDRDESEPRTEESPIIDVPAEPHPPEDDWTPEPSFGGAHRRQSEAEAENRRRTGEVPPAWRAQTAQPAQNAQTVQPPPPPPPPAPPAQPPPQPAPAQPQPQFAWRPPPHEPPPPAQRPPAPPPPPQAPATDWQPAPADGLFIPAGAPGSNWVSTPVENGSADEYVGRRRAADSDTPPPAQPAAPSAPPPEPVEQELPPQPVEQVPPAPPAESVAPAPPAESVAPAPPTMTTGAAGDRRGRHSAPPEAADPGRPPSPTLAAEPPQPPKPPGPPEHPGPPGPPEPPPSSPEPIRSRHHGEGEPEAEPEAEEGQHAGGQSVTELLARFQAAPTGGGRRRRREE